MRLDLIFFFPVAGCFGATLFGFTDFVGACERGESIFFRDLSDLEGATCLIFDTAEPVTLAGWTSGFFLGGCVITECVGLCL